jgi:hypothetical protein
MAHDVFISHSSKDKQIADAVCAALEARGIRCWVAPRDILPGKNWGASIIEAIKGARVMVLVFSGYANESPQILVEVERAVNKGVVIISMRIEDVLPTESLELFLSARHWLDAFTPPLERHLEYLANTINQILAEARSLRATPTPIPDPVRREPKSKPEENKNAAVEVASPSAVPGAGTAPTPVGAQRSERSKVPWKLIAAGLLLVVASGVTWLARGPTPTTSGPAGAPAAPVTTPSGPDQQTPSRQDSGQAGDTGAQTGAIGGPSEKSSSPAPSQTVNLTTQSSAYALPQARADVRAPEKGSTWPGTLNYSSNDRPINVRFTMYIAEVAATADAHNYNITGTISEPRSDFGPTNQSVLTSTFTGSWNGTHLSFTKSYDYDGHTVEYTGEYDESSGSVSGVWTIGDIHGPFTLTSVKLVGSAN